jgi:hypothetical protein
MDSAPRSEPTRRRARAALLGLAIAAAIAGCGKTGGVQASGGGPTRKLAPVAAQGAVSVTTRNTTRLGGENAAADAAAVARAVYPGLTTETRPRAVVVVDDRNWSAALAASVLASAPTGAPVLYSDGGSLPDVSRQSLEAMHPIGDTALGGAQVVSLGSSAPLPGGLITRSVAVGEPAVTGASIERLARLADGAAPREVIVVAASAPRALQMPAAGLAAESGAPILFVTPARVPPATAAVLGELRRPSIYVVGASAVGARTLAELSRLGHVSIVSDGGPLAADAVASSIAVARYTDGSFGWGVKEPGHGLVFANVARPLDAPAAAPLSATGDYGPLLLLDSAARLPAALVSYLGDIQPAYTSAPQFRPVKGVYNHGWLIGDESAISPVTQAEIDSQLEISPRRQSSEEAAVSQAE